MAGLSYDPRTNKVSSYEPTYTPANVNSFMQIVEKALASRPSVGSRTTQHSKLYGNETAPFLQAMDRTSGLNQALAQVKKNPAAWARGKKRADLPPELQQLYDQVTAEEKKAKTAKPKQNHGLFHRVLDVLSRGNYAVAEGAMQGFNKAEHGGNILQTAGSFFHGAEQGITGKKKTNFEDVIQHIADQAASAKSGRSMDDPLNQGAGHVNPILKFGAGISADIFLDPTTYLGVGVVKDAVKLSGLAKGAKGVDKAAEAERLSTILHDHYGISIPGIDAAGNEVKANKAALKGFLEQPGPLNANVSAASRQGRIDDVLKLAAQIRPAVMSAEKNHLIEEYFNSSGKKLIDITPSHTKSVTKVMAKPVTKEDMVDFTKYRTWRGELNSQRATIAKQINKARIAWTGSKSLAKRTEIESFVSAKKVELEQIDKKLAETEAKFNERFGAVPLATDAEMLAKVKAVPEVAKAQEAYKEAVRKGGKQEIAKTRELRDSAFAHAALEVMASSVEKPKRGTFASLVQSSKFSDKRLVESFINATNDQVPILRKELAFRYAEKGDAWLQKQIKVAEKLGNNDLVNELRTVTPLERGAKDLPKVHHVVHEDMHIEGMTPAEVRRATQFNHSVMREAAKYAEAESAKIADSLESSLMEMVVKETSPLTRKKLAIRMTVPFTKRADLANHKTMLALSLPHAVTQAINKYVMRDTIKEGLTRWKKWFQSSAGTDPLMNRVRLSLTGHANQVIEYHANRLRAAFQEFPPAQRRAGLRQYLKHGWNGDEAGPYGQIVSRIDTEVKLLTAAMTKPVEHAGDAINFAALNNWMPNAFKLQKPTELDKISQSGDAIRVALRHVAEDADPAEILWHLNIAREKALHRVALKDNIREVFGVERNAQNAHMIEQMVKQYGFKSVEGMGKHFFFRPEVADDIAKTLKLTENPREINDLVKFYDQLMGVWKSSVTVYNPGYHIRNAWGDGFVNYLAGVSGASGIKSYRSAFRTMRAMKVLDDSNPVKQAVMSVSPQDTFAQQEIRANTPVFKTKHGKSVSAEELWVLYSHYGLHSGFVSNEFGQAFGKPGTLRATRAGQAATTVNRGMRAASEWREDVWRLAHFIHKIKTSNIKDLEMAAGQAADSVRKYLFDYGDFTAAEKATIIRMIPFYKWTRKALPLMVEMLFAQPGKALMYPKVMRDASQAMGYQMQDSGLFPGSDLVLPGWVSDRGMFPMGTHNGNTVLMDPSNPMDDVLKTLQHPGESLVSMLTPGLRIPIELQSGRQLYGDIPIISKQDYFMRQTPETSFLQQMLKKNQVGDTQGVAGNLTDPRTLQFLTALGLFENTNTQIKNTLYGRKAKADAKIKSNNMKAKKKRGNQPYYENRP